MQPAVEAATALLGYAFSLHVRQQAAFVLSECIKCVATAAAYVACACASAPSAGMDGLWSAAHIFMSLAGKGLMYPKIIN